MFSNEEIIAAFGPYSPAETFTEAVLQDHIRVLEQFPAQLHHFFSQLRPEHELACYRQGGWTYRQVVHHLADSHMQAFARFKLALTEEQPVIKPYIQNAWANTPDCLLGHAADSIELLNMVHKRLTLLMRNMRMEDFERSYFHPESGKTFNLAYVSGMYAWHGKHHLTQIKRHAFNQGWIHSSD